MHCELWLPRRSFVQCKTHAREGEATLQMAKFVSQGIRAIFAMMCILDEKVSIAEGVQASQFALR